MRDRVSAPECALEERARLRLPTVRYMLLSWVHGPVLRAATCISPLLSAASCLSAASRATGWIEGQGAYRCTCAWNNVSQASLQEQGGLVTVVATLADVVRWPVAARTLVAAQWHLIHDSGDSGGQARPVSLVVAKKMGDGCCAREGARAVRRMGLDDGSWADGWTGRLELRCGLAVRESCAR